MVRCSETQEYRQIYVLTYINSLMDFNWRKKCNPYLCSAEEGLLEPVKAHADLHRLYSLNLRVAQTLKETEGGFHLLNWGTKTLVG